jgi:hypothetical protein
MSFALPSALLIHVSHNALRPLNRSNDHASRARAASGCERGHAQGKARIFLEVTNVTKVTIGSDASHCREVSGAIK